MLTGPDLSVILGIALMVFEPKTLPELAKTIGRAMTAFKKTTGEMKESNGFKGQVSIPVEYGLEKEKKEKLEGSKGEQLREGVPS